jgi:hypothetical protein
MYLLQYIERKYEAYELQQPSMHWRVHFSELLKMLERNQVGDLHDLASAVAGLSAQEFSNSPEDIKESHRIRFIRKPIYC